MYWVPLKDRARSGYVKEMHRAGHGGRDVSPHWVTGCATNWEALPVLPFKN